MKTKVIAFDVYGTILMTDDPENCVPARDGFVEFTNRCIDMGITLVTSSDNGAILVKIDLSASGVDLGIFDSFFRMNRGEPKNFIPIIDHFHINPDELLVFGDRRDLDIEAAILQGCQAVLLPRFESINDNFNWMSVLDSII